MMKKRMSFAALAVLLSACGGGGGDSGGSGGSGGGNTPQFTVSAVAGANGTISPTSRSVAQGQTTSFTVTPAAGYNIASVTGCAGSLSGNTYTTGVITAACTVNASFAAASYTISATAGAGGAISPASATASYGETLSFALTPEPGFRVVEVTGCAGSLSGNTYTTGAITAACAVNATFAAEAYRITVSYTPGGSVSPGIATVSYGEEVEFTLTPDTGYQVASVTGCGGTLQGNVYRTAPVTANCQLTVNFAVGEYVVSTAVSGNGVISPTSTVVRYGEQAQFQIQADTGYNIDAVTGCNGTLNGTLYSTGPITENCTVAAVFAAQTFTINASSSAGGSITPAVVTARTGERVEFTYAENSGFRLAGISGCNGVYQGNRYITQSVTGNCNVSARFNDARYVEFGDPAVAKAVREALNIATDAPVPIERLQTDLTVLTLSSLQVSNLDGLQYATNLQDLDAYNNYITDFSVLGLEAAKTGTPSKLRSLSLSLNRISSLPDMSVFANLTILNINNNSISDISALLALPDLRSLSVASNQITDFSPLYAFNKLNYLSASGPEFTDEVALNINAPDLTGLNIWSSAITRLDSLLHFTKLENFTVDYSLIEDLSQLKTFSKLASFSFYGTPVIDIKPLLDLTRPNLWLSMGGCVRTDSASRGAKVIEQLRQRGHSVNIYNWVQSPYCAEDNTVTNLTAAAKMTAEGLAVSWQAQSSDNGPWQCELHLDLENQQPRVPVVTVPDCHLTSNMVVTEPLREGVTAHWFLDTGLSREKKRVDIGAIQYDIERPAVHLASYDWLQTVVKANPYLVPWREARLRLHVLSAERLTVPEMTVKARFEGVVTPLSVRKPQSLDAQKNHQQLEYSYLVTVPASLMAPGTEFEVQLADQPARIVRPAFANFNSIDLHLVPFKVGSTETTLPTNDLVERSLLTFWPLANVKITTRPLYEVATPAELTTTSTMLYELADLRTLENGTSYYYGYFARGMNVDTGVAGRAFIPGAAGVGVVPGAEIDTTLSHELGHNFSIPHAPCGNPDGPDSSYPYANGWIGSVGVELNFNSLLQPNAYYDLMSYCGPQHVSDYNYDLVQDYLANLITEERVSLRQTAANAAEAQQQVAANSAKQAALFYRVALNNGKADFKQAMQINYLPSLKGDSAYSVLAEYTDGFPRLFPVEPLINAYDVAGQQFSFAVPLALDGHQLTRWTLYHKNSLVHVYDVAAVAKAVHAQQAANDVDIRLEERSGQVCVALDNVQFDGANLLLVTPTQPYAVALNVTEPEFCRDVGSYPADGIWQLQLRQGAALTTKQFQR